MPFPLFRLYKNLQNYNRIVFNDEGLLTSHETPPTLEDYSLMSASNLLFAAEDMPYCIGKVYH